MSGWGFGKIPAEEFVFSKVTALCLRPGLGNELFRSVFKDFT